MAKRRPKRPGRPAPEASEHREKANESTPAYGTSSDWPRKFRETFDLWRGLNPNLYNHLLPLGD